MCVRIYTHTHTHTLFWGLLGLLESRDWGPMTATPKGYCRYTTPVSPHQGTVAEEWLTTQDLSHTILIGH